MKLKLFIDTWGWLTLQDKRESQYKEVSSFYRNFREQKGICYTTDYVLDETFTLLFKRLPFESAKESLETIDAAIKKGYLILYHVTPECFEKDKKLRLKFQDKPQISFTDFTSMVAMNENKITEILTEDEHFVQVGMGFRIVTKGK